MTIQQLRQLAVYHAEQANNLSEAASVMRSDCGAEQDFRAKANWHREMSERLAELASAFATFTQIIKS
jgi:hypothetical protein